MENMMIKKKVAEFRTLPGERKGLEEKRSLLVEEMGDMINKADAETRTLSEDEAKRFNEIKTEIDSIDTTLAAIEENRTLQQGKPLNTKTKEQRVIDEENFINFIRGEERALTVADNGGVIPTTIANRIIETVKELSPLYKMADIYNVNGDLVFPVYDEESSSVKQYMLMI